MSVLKQYNPSTGQWETVVIGKQGPQGDQGEQGIQGEVGPGVAAGGNYGDVLIKSSSDDYDTEWTDAPAALGRHTHAQTIVDSIWDVTHNLNRYPIVSVIDSSGTTVYGDIENVSLNRTILTFQSPFSGTAEFV